MASRGSRGGGGCLGAIAAFFILFFLPAWVTGDSFGWGVLIVWWVILALICFGIYAASTSSNSTITSTTQRTTQNYNTQTAVTQKGNSSTVPAGMLKVSANQLNRSLMDGYSSKIQLRKKLKESIVKLKEEQQRIDKTIEQKKTQQHGIREGKGKPLFTAKKKWLALKQPEIDSLEQAIIDLEEEMSENEAQIVQIEKQVDELKFNVFDESNTAFEKLKAAFEKVKKSCKVSGSPNLVSSVISTAQRDKDLRYVSYKTVPYGLLLENYRFYFFPNGIWVFEDDAKLVGVYKPKALQGFFETKETIKQSYYSSYSRKPDVYDDTKIITKDIPHHTWLHTCRDGSPDMRYSHNPMRTYYTKQEYYVECSFDLDLCGCKLKYTISSFDNCEILEEAIKNYAVIKENKDMIPILLDLINRCTDGQDIKLIREKMAIH